MLTPLVADMNHNNTVIFDRIVAAGIIGVIHKATQGSGFTDHLYALRRQLAKRVGLCWGAYHFNDGSDVEKQVQHFLDVAQPDEHTSLWLDFEDNPRSNMSIDQAREFLQLVDKKTGRYCGIYGGNRIKENLPHPDAFFGKHRLWLCQYGPVAKIPNSWQNYFLWQYTGDGVGPKPHSVPGLEPGADLNTYGGTVDELRRNWANPLIGD